MPEGRCLCCGTAADIPPWHDWYVLPWKETFWAFTCCQIFVQHNQKWCDMLQNNRNGEINVIMKKRNTQNELYRKQNHTQKLHCPYFDWQICIFRKRVGIPLYIVFLHVDYYQFQKKRSDYVKSCILLLIPFWCQIDSWCHVTRKKCQPPHFLRNSCTNSILLSRPWVWVSRDISFLSICENFAVFYVGKIVTLWRPRLDKIQIILT